MDLQEIYQKLSSDIKEVFPSSKISQEKIKTIGKNYTGIKVSFDNDSVSPVFDLNKAKSLIAEGIEYKDIKNRIVSSIKESIIHPSVNLRILDDYDLLRPFLCIDVVLINGNEAYLNSIPHRRLTDNLCIIPKAIVSSPSLNSSLFSSVTIKYNIANKLGVSFDTLINDAIENAEKINSSVILEPSELLEAEWQENVEIFTHNNAKLPVQLLTTQTGVFPLSALVSLTTNNLQSIALNENSFIIPTENFSFILDDNFPKSKETAYLLKRALYDSHTIPFGDILYYDADERNLLEINILDAKLGRGLDFQTKDILKAPKDALEISPGK